MNEVRDSGYVSIIFETILKSSIVNMLICMLSMIRK